MTGSPSIVEAKQLAEVHLTVTVDSVVQKEDL